MRRPEPRQVVITGVGVVAPLGIGREAFWTAMLAGRSGVVPLTLFDASGLPAPFGGQVSDFEPKRYVRPRKSLKVMSREIQFGYTAADLAWSDARLPAAAVAPERLGVVFGADMMYCRLDDVEDAYRSCVVNGTFDFSRWGEHALARLYPLWMLKYLPNMAACHIGIARDARGPTNTITLAEASSLLAVAEGTRVIQRGAADVMIVGGTGTRLHPTLLASHGNALLAPGQDGPARACRPFDRRREGMVNGEGAAALVLESADHATNRGARVWARVVGSASGFEPGANGTAPQGTAVDHTIRTALASARLTADQVGHVNANGFGTRSHDRREARAIHQALGHVPVTAPKSFFGNLGAGTGAVEMVASVLAVATGQVPVTLNFEQPDPECPVRVVHGRPLSDRPPTAVVLNQTLAGQTVAVVLAAPDWSQDR